jgi:hypothetical protein
MRFSPDPFFLDLALLCIGPVAPEHASLDTRDTFRTSPQHML